MSGDSVSVASKNASNKKETTLSSEIFSAAMQSPFYPMAYVKVLIQIGHEPLPPFRARSLFGREQFFYPNSFSYLRYIYSVEGVSGLYRGVGMKIISQSVGNIVYDRFNRWMGDGEESEQNKNIEIDTTRIFFKQTTREIAARCYGIVVSHPFHVMALRCMAQFVGGETNYSSWNIFQNSIEIYRSEGILGFFSGLIPRLLFEASTIALTNSIAFLIKTYIFEEKDVDALIDLFSSLLASSVTYPLSVVSTVTSISGSALIAGRPPRMALYESWIDAFRHLHENNDLKRGSSSFFRIYKQPLAMPPINGGFTLNQHPSVQSSYLRKTL